MRCSALWVGKFCAGDRRQAHLFQLGLADQPVIVEVDYMQPLADSLLGIIQLFLQTHEDAAHALLKRLWIGSRKMNCEVRR